MLVRNSLLLHRVGSFHGLRSCFVCNCASFSTVNPDRSEEERILRPPHGTRDFNPSSHRFKEWLFGQWSKAAVSHGFLLYDAPVVEFEELYIRKSGEDVSKQMYNLEDPSGQRLSLRPEMTPSLARMVLAKKDSLKFPLRWYSFPQCWRFETTTIGRRREHYQWNMDIWGNSGVEAEAELISAAVMSMKNMGLKSSDVVIRINSRKILNELMKLLGISEDKWTSTFLLMDRLEKLPPNVVRDELSTLGLTDSAIDDLISSLQIKDIQHFVDKLGANSEGVADILKLFKLLSYYGIEDWIQFDASIVRGLAYYTGIVFEAFDREGQLRAICGGGRYDNLLQSMYGAEGIPGVGFGFGDAVVEELLKLKGLLPDVTTPQVDTILYTMDSKLREVATKIANDLRNAGRSVDYVIEEKWKPKWVFQRGDRMGASSVIMLASSEHKKGEVVFKNLKNRTQTTVKYENIVDEVNNLVN